MTKYFGNRQNSTSLSNAELDGVFKCIADHFGHDWIKSNRSHPLQQLWNRKDPHSTNELYFFGASLQRMSAADPKWVKAQVRQIKSDHVNNRLGAFFEINGLGLLQTEKQVVVPAAGSNPGYDGTLMLTDGKSIRLSLKNYGDSSALREFSAYARQIEEQLKRVLKEKNVPPQQIVIDAFKKFPGKSEWKSLADNLPSLLNEVKKGQGKVYGVADFWAFMRWDLSDDYQEFHSHYQSYQLIVSSNYHPNEEKNLLSKLDEACANLIKHQKTEDDNTINAVFVHLPESASLTKCKEWAEDYFKNFPDKPITSIILYQPTLSSDIEKGTNFIYHGFQIVVREKQFAQWNTNSTQIDFSIPVGLIGSADTEKMLYAEIENERRMIEFTGKYVYQRGNLYLQARTGPDGSLTGNIKQLASGIFAHSVFQPFPDQPSFTLSGHFPPEHKLLIV